MNENKVVPFGKYKGRLVEEMVGDDNYVQWLTAQDWFRERYANLYQIVINRGGEPSETPEHNALQVRFLEDDFCWRFLRHVRAKRLAEAEEQLLAIHRDSLAAIAKDMEDCRKRIAEPIALSPSDYYRTQPDRGANELKRLQERQDKAKAELVTLEHEHAEHRSPPKIDRTITTRAFECQGIDVVLNVKFEAANAHRATAWEHTYQGKTGWFGSVENLQVNVEIKPTLGDDYPAVLRQMKTNRSNVLLLDRYTGTGATRDQLVRTFATADIAVAFRADFDNPV